MCGKFLSFSRKCFFRLVHELGPNTLKCRRFFGGFICFIRVFLIYLFEYIIVHMVNFFFYFS